jgi:hypothetical protein
MDLQGGVACGCVLRGRDNRRPLHCAPPDFLTRPVALMICMRLSQRRAANWSSPAARSRKSGYAPVGMTRGVRLRFGRLATSMDFGYKQLLCEVALMICMRLSVRRAANVVVARSAKQEIRVRLGRDDMGRVVTFRKGSDLDGPGYKRLPCEDRKTHLP